MKRGVFVDGRFVVCGEPDRGLSIGCLGRAVNGASGCTCILWTPGQKRWAQLYQITAETRDDFEKALKVGFMRREGYPDYPRNQVPYGAPGSKRFEATLREARLDAWKVAQGVKS